MRMATVGLFALSVVACGDERETRNPGSNVPIVGTSVTDFQTRVQATGGTSIYVNCGSTLPTVLRVVIAEGSLNAGDVALKSVTGTPFDETLSPVDLPMTLDEVRVWSPTVN